MVKSIIFDFDGTIIDTETIWYRVFKDIYKIHGVELTLEEYAKCLGTDLGLFNPYTHLSTHHNIPIDLDEFRQHVQKTHAQIMEKEMMRPGVLKCLRDAKSLGLKIGLASSSNRAWIDKYLNSLGIRDYFDCICTSDTVKNVKPDPELYTQALQKLAVSPHEAIAIEDSPNGAEASVAAGIQTIVIKNEITKQLPFYTIHKTIESLDELKLEELIHNIQ